jgi:hypothetical protein
MERTESRAAGPRAGRQAAVGMARVLAVGALGMAAAIGLTAYGTFAGADRATESAYWIVVGISAAVAVLVFGLIVPRALRDGDAGRRARTGLITSLIALLSVAVFWSGLPPILGSAGILLGHEALRVRRGGTEPAGMPRAAIVLGILALVGMAFAVATD